MADYEVSCDRERQIVVQRLNGGMTLDDIMKLRELTAACAQQLGDPNHIRLLVYLGTVSRPRIDERAAAMEPIREKEIHRVAFFSKDIALRTMFKLTILGGHLSHCRVFSSEAKAVQWLLG